MIWVKYKNSLSELRPFLESVSLAFTTSNTFYGNDALVPAKHRLPQKSIWAKFTVKLKDAQFFFVCEFRGDFQQTRPAVSTSQQQKQVDEFASAATVDG